MDCYPWPEISDHIERTALHAHDDLDEEGGKDDGESKELRNYNEQRLRLEVSILAINITTTKTNTYHRHPQAMQSTLRLQATGKGHIALRRWTVICMGHC